MDIKPGQHTQQKCWRSWDAKSWGTSVQTQPDGAHEGALHTCCGLNRRPTGVEAGGLDWLVAVRGTWWRCCSRPGVRVVAQQSASKEAKQWQGDQASRLPSRLSTAHADSRLVACLQKCLHGGMHVGVACHAMQSRAVALYPPEACDGCLRILTSGCSKRQTRQNACAKCRKASLERLW